MDVIINMTEEFFPGEISVIELNPNRSPRIFWDLMNNGIYTIGQLITKTRGELTALYGFVDELDDIEEYLAKMNLKLKEIDLSKIKKLFPDETPIYEIDPEGLFLIPEDYDKLIDSKILTIEQLITYSGDELFDMFKDEELVEFIEICLKQKNLKLKEN